jgi:triosephosphate isomerase (TIM)
MRRIIAGNWKMNGLADVAGALAEGISVSLEANPACDVVVCPPFTAISEVTKILKGSGVATGGQDCHAEATGAFTGSVSAEMLADLGCRYVIVGHSERRHGLGETDEMVFAKAEAAHRAGLTPIICVGETQAEREAGRAIEVVARQIKGSVPVEGGAVVVAYEPVWAIGTGLVPTMADVEEVHRHIRSDLEVIRGDSGDIPIQYGGSAKPENAAELLAVPEVDGLLIGGASLDAASFCAMVDAAG